MRLLFATAFVTFNLFAAVSMAQTSPLEQLSDDWRDFVYVGVQEGDFVFYKAINEDNDRPPAVVLRMANTELGNIREARIDNSIDGVLFLKSGAMSIKFAPAIEESDSGSMLGTLYHWDDIGSPEKIDLGSDFGRGGKYTLQKGTDLPMMAVSPNRKSFCLLETRNRQQPLVCARVYDERGNELDQHLMCRGFGRVRQVCINDFQSVLCSNVHNQTPWKGSWLYIASSEKPGSIANRPQIPKSKFFYSELQAFALRGEPGFVLGGTFKPATISKRYMAGPRANSSMESGFFMASINEAGKVFDTQHHMADVQAIDHIIWPSELEMGFWYDGTPKAYLHDIFVRESGTVNLIGEYTIQYYRGQHGEAHPVSVIVVMQLKKNRALSQSHHFKVQSNQYEVEHTPTFGSFYDEEEDLLGLYYRNSFAAEPAENARSIIQAGKDLHLLLIGAEPNEILIRLPESFFEQRQHTDPRDINVEPFFTRDIRQFNNWQRDGFSSPMFFLRDTDGNLYRLLE